MIKIEEALKIILGHIKDVSPETEEIKLDNMLDRVLAEDVYAKINIPQMDNSAMDGYALKFLDTFGVDKLKSKTLKVIHDLPAGTVTDKKIKTGEVIRIMTGASMPQGADSVIMVEDTEKEKEDYVKVFREVKVGENVRKNGEDIKKGDLVISKGTLLNPACIGLLASLGISKVKVNKKPEVAVLATGDEVKDVEEKLTPGALYNSNTYTLYSSIIKCGAIPKNLGIAKDCLEELEEHIKKGLDSDIILTSGGISVGDYDFVKPVLAKMGTDIKFWKVAIKPGKPLVFGMIFGPKGKRIPMFGLPGNPVSSMVSFEVFVRPVILKMLGQ